MTSCDRLGENRQIRTPLESSYRSTSPTTSEESCPWVFPDASWFENGDPICKLWPECRSDEDQRTTPHSTDKKIDNGDPNGSNIEESPSDDYEDWEVELIGKEGEGVTGSLASNDPQINDALLFIDGLKVEFKDAPQKFNEFLHIMKSFKNKVYDVASVKRLISELLHGKKELIISFNAFLPDTEKIYFGTTTEAKNENSDSSTARKKLDSDTHEKAVGFIEKIRAFYIHEPHKFRRFVGILNDYKNSQPFSGSHSNQDAIDKVKLDVKKLFADEIDLMLEFTRFLEEGDKNNSTVTPEPYKKENYWKAYSFIPEAERLFKDCRTRGEIESTSLFISPKAVQRLLPIVAKVPRTTLADVWELVHVNDHDNGLTVEELAVALYLCHLAEREIELPNRLPPRLIPPNFATKQLQSMRLRNRYQRKLYCTTDGEWYEAKALKHWMNRFRVSPTTHEAVAFEALVTEEEMKLLMKPRTTDVLRDLKSLDFGISKARYYLFSSEQLKAAGYDNTT